MDDDQEIEERYEILASETRKELVDSRKKYKMPQAELTRFNKETYSEQKHEKIGQRTGQYFVNYFLPEEFFPCPDLFYATQEEFWDRFDNFVEILPG